MSRRRGEFEHRTSIFEGAFRAWSYLGGLEPTELETKTLSELDPLTPDAESRAKIDPRLKASDYQQGDGAAGSSGAAAKPGEKKPYRRIYPYEPLPRSGLAHPFVQAILSPWLGPEAEQNAIQLGLTTLRTWWQHRRKGESGSAISALGTDKMRGVVEGYTRHFFSLAYCLVTNDGEQPPRSLHTKMKELEKQRAKKFKKRAREEEAGKLAALALNAGLAHGLNVPPGEEEDGMGGGGGAHQDNNDDNLSPLERLARAHQMQQSGSNRKVGIQTPHSAALALKGKCMPGKLDLQQLALQMSAHGTQVMHSGGNGPGGSGNGATPDNMDSGPSDNNAIGPSMGPSLPGPQPPTSSNFGSQQPMVGPMPNPTPGATYRDPEADRDTEPSGTTPVVLISPKGDIQIAMSVDGITCAHCVKIVETVLKGCNGNKSPITGLVDAAADHDLCSVLIKIDKSSNAKRIAREASRNLMMVGYTGKVKEMNITNMKISSRSSPSCCPPNGGGGGGNGKVNMNMLNAAFDVVAEQEPVDVFDWDIACNCPDNGVLRQDCTRHSQMNKRIFDAFDRRAAQVSEFLTGCGKKYGQECTCGPSCQCPNCCEHSNINNKDKNEAANLLASAAAQHHEQHEQHRHAQTHLQASLQQLAAHTSNNAAVMAAAAAGVAFQGGGNSHQMEMSQAQIAAHLTAAAAEAAGGRGRGDSTRQSINSLGRRRMSGQSTETFGRAMSGLSQLSIDWENMDDFDVNVDHSAHINNAYVANPPSKIGPTGPPVGHDRRAI